MRHRRDPAAPRPRKPAAVSFTYVLDAIKAVGCGDVALLLVDERAFAAACMEERDRTRGAARRAGLDQLAGSDAALVRTALTALGVVVFPRRAYSPR
ncbi:hypothetical protein Q5424_01230 [Conexibacter sp. JD483]|uniref:hypothetical protein n=1 Tax=unclassified Conexibacter TaxID=2627773 RepID=UPI0027281FD2|nr:MULTISPECIES: hypothetical protein [unclassified Conexibacter]MDO8185851.1 hypothetical protein [Conexibacter sp. CPCC 205706]MDO8198595.1 hypothetical protein [Conexibacter sp. CPCC 205762]MDR9367681.1 hypothetical protein [Conexibacter sp. JD483]